MCCWPLQMLNFQSMCIMADLGDETTVAGSNEKVLCVLRAHTDGSFDMTPGFTSPAQRYRFEDDHGGLLDTAGPALCRYCGTSLACAHLAVQPMLAVHYRLMPGSMQCPAGSIYEYTLELASQTSAPSLEKHTAKLASVVAAQAQDLRRQHNKDRLPLPGELARHLRAAPHLAAALVVGTARLVGTCWPAMWHRVTLFLMASTCSGAGLHQG